MTTRTFDMSNTIEAVDPMVVTLRTVVAPLIADDTRFRFEICVTEALANIVTHAADADPDAPIKIVLNVTAGRASIEIFDPAGVTPFDVRTHAVDLSQVDAMAEGSRGLGLILECANDIKYGPSGTQNSLCLGFWDHEQDDSQAANGARNE